MTKVKSLGALEALYKAGIPEGAIRKVAKDLTPTYRTWVETARFCVMSTAGEGHVHGSPRGDIDPVVRVHDPKKILMPDRRGNNRLDCLRDIVTDGRIALLFMIKGTNTTVRVNGQAYLSTDAELLTSFERKGRHPVTVIVTQVQEVYTQCAKALMRSQLWEWDGTEGLPTVGDMLAEMTKGDLGGADYDATYEANATPRLW